MICYSGGAIGSDTCFQVECEKRNIGIINFSFKGHNTGLDKRLNLNSEQLNEGWEHVLEANKILKRNIYSLSYYVRNLLSRNWFQVKDSDAIYAIGTIQPNMKIVNGGTGWAIAESIINKKLIYTFDQEEKSWFIFNYEKNLFEKFEGVPKLVDKFAGIGTRNINIYGENAIKELFEKHFSLNGNGDIE